MLNNMWLAAAGLLCRGQNIAGNCVNIGTTTNEWTNDGKRNMINNGITWDGEGQRDLIKNIYAREAVFFLGDVRWWWWWVTRHFDELPIKLSSFPLSLRLP